MARSEKPPVVRQGPAWAMDKKTVPTRQDRDEQRRRAVDAMKKAHQPDTSDLPIDRHAPKPKPNRRPALREDPVS